MKDYAQDTDYKQMTFKIIFKSRVMINNSLHNNQIKNIPKN